MDTPIIVLIALLVTGLIAYFAQKSVRKDYEEEIDSNEYQKVLDLAKQHQLRLLNAHLTKTLVRIIVKTKNGVTIIKDFCDTVEDEETSPRIALARDKANIYIRSITDDDGVVEKGDMIYPSHMVESIQRIVVE